MPCWRLVVLAFELMDQERLLAAAPLFSSRAIGTANSEDTPGQRNEQSLSFLASQKLGMTVNSGVISK